MKQREKQLATPSKKFQQVKYYEKFKIRIFKKLEALLCT